MLLFLSNLIAESLQVLTAIFCSKKICVTSSKIASTIALDTENRFFIFCLGLVSSVTLKKQLAKICPQWKKGLAKRVLAKALDSGVVEQIRASYKVNAKALEKARSGAGKKKKSTTPKKPLAQAPKKLSKSRTIPGTKGRRGPTSSASKVDRPSVPLEDILPHIITWVCEPKEASVNVIKKYITKHFEGKLDLAKLPKALLNGNF